MVTSIEGKAVEEAKTPIAGRFLRQREGKRQQQGINRNTWMEVWYV